MYEDIPESHDDDVPSGLTAVAIYDYQAGAYYSLNSPAFTNLSPPKVKCHSSPHPILKQDGSESWPLW